MMREEQPGRELPVLFKLFRYSISGGIAGVLSLCVAVALNHFQVMSYLLDQGIGALAGAFINFPLSRSWAFDNRYPKVGRQLVWFVSVALVGFIVNEVALWLMVTRLHCWVPLSMAVGLGTGFLWNFSVNNYVTFGKLR